MLEFIRYQCKMCGKQYQIESNLSFICECGYEGNKQEKTMITEEQENEILKRIEKMGASKKTLRDEIAIAALSGELSCQSENYYTVNRCDYKGLADRCYEIADAMLKARDGE